MNAGIAQADSARELVAAMENASEQAWCAAWLNGTESALWARLEQWRVHGAASSWGLLDGRELHDCLSRLDRLSEAAVAWAVYGLVGPEAVSLQDWLSTHWPAAKNDHHELARKVPLCGRFVETDSQGAAVMFMARCTHPAGHLGECAA